MVRAARTGAERYEEKRRRAAEESRRLTAEGQDIGEIPDIVDVRRRGRCRKSLRLFCETYNPEAFAMGWSPDHLAAISRIEEAVTSGALYAFAMARGSGKTTLCRHGALWAVSYGLCRYAYLIGATDGKASDALEAIRMFLRFLPAYAEDFPEIAYPVAKLRGSARLAAGQTCLSKPTMIQWVNDTIVLPTVPPPSNWPRSWRLRDDGMVPSSGSVLAISGLTGEGIRGSLRTLTTGEQVRPDLVILDDPQTAESSRSRTQNATREQLISADVLGMAGPGKSISAIMPCTVIAPGDCIDRMTDREKHPLWRGERTGILRSMPSDMAAWDGYFDVYRRCATKEPPDFGEANDYYRAHRAALDAGAVASWEERKLPGEVSAVQHAMNLYARDRRAFMAEYMNRPEPLDVDDLADELDPAAVSRRVNGVPRGEVPAECSRLVAYIDCGAAILHYVVVGWGEQFAGSVVDYGTYPRQPREYYAARDARPSLSDLYPGLTEDARVYAGLKELAPRVCGLYPRHGGGEQAVERCLIDAGKWTKTVTQFVRQSPLAPLLTPAKGFGIGAGRPPMANWPVRAGEKAGDHWRLRPNTEGGHGRLVLIDTNHWKTFAAAALQSREVRGCSLHLFGDAKDGPRVHRLFADHLTAEYSVRVRRDEGDRRPVDVWSVRPDRPDNHWWDCVTGCCVAGSMLGLAWDSGAAAGDPARPREKPKTVSYRELQQKARAGR